MNQRSFKLLTEVCVFLAVTPMAWFVYSSASGAVQLGFVAVLAGAAFLLRRFIYLPILKRLPEQEHIDRSSQ